MAKHNVIFSLPERPLGKQDVRFRIVTDGARAGVLGVSNGAIVWFPKGGKKGFKLGWQRFDQLMQDNGRKAERR